MLVALAPAGIIIIMYESDVPGLWEYIYREVLYLPWMDVPSVSLVQGEFSQLFFSFMSPALVGGSFTTSTTWEANLFEDLFSILWGI